MLKNNKGVTMLALIITIILLVILAGVSVNTVFSVMDNVRVGRIVSNMTLVQAKAEAINDEYEFYNNDTDCLVGMNSGKINQLENINISPEEIAIIAQKAQVKENDVSNWDWYKWDSSVLEKQGVDKAILAPDEAFYVNYEHAEIIYSSGTSYDNEHYFYSMTGLNYLLENS